MRYILSYSKCTKRNKDVLCYFMHKNAYSIQYLHKSCVHLNLTLTLNPTMLSALGGGSTTVLSVSKPALKEWHKNDFGCAYGCFSYYERNPEHQFLYKAFHRKKKSVGVVYKCSPEFCSQEQSWAQVTFPPVLLKYDSHSKQWWSYCQGAKYYGIVQVVNRQITSFDKIPQKT